MPLIDLKTNLKDLKFGHDEYKGGSSNEPYIQTRIPATNESLQTTISISGNNLIQTIGSTALSAGAGALIGGIGGSIVGSTGTGAVIGAAAGLGLGIAGNTLTGNSVSIKFPTAGTGGPDFLIRGGSLLPNYVADDFVRLNKFFADTKGVLFTIKQNLLSRIGTRAQGTVGILNERLYTPISTILGAVGSPIGLHTNKQGLNPFLGIGEEYVPDRYFTALADQIKELDQNPGSDAITHNKLYGLYAVKLLKENLMPFYIRNGIADKNSINLFSYQGGPGSFLGIGKTNISLATDNVGAPLLTSDNITSNTLDYKQLEEISKEVGNKYFPKVVDFRTKLKSTLFNSTLVSKSPSYDPADGKTLEIRTKLGDPGSANQKNITSYTNGYTGDVGTSFGAASPNSYDRINALPIYQETENSIIGPNQYDEDLVNFYIGIIDNDNPTNKEYLHFRAFLNTITDTYNSAWSDTRYIGRGEKFYTYNGFDRKVSLSWTVAAQSRAELNSMYKKLNFLASVCAPDYSPSGYMRGNLITLTIGDLFYQQPGIITGFSYEMNDENGTWEIGIDDEGSTRTGIPIVPHLIKINSFEFIPIHEFVPRKQQNIYNNSEYKGLINEYGKERYIVENLNWATNTNPNGSTFPSTEDIKLSNFDGLPISGTPPTPGSVPLQSAAGVETSEIANNPFSFR